MQHLPLLLRLWFANLWVAMTTERMFVDVAQKNVLLYHFEADSKRGSVVRLRFKRDGKDLWEKTLHQSDGAFLDGAQIKLMQAGEVLKSVRPTDTNVTTYSDEAGSAVFSMNWDDDHFDLEGIVAANDTVYEVGAGDKLEVSNQSDDFGICAGADLKGNHSRRLAVQRWTNCYSGDWATRTFSIGVAIGSGLFKRKFRNSYSAATQWINAIVSDANLIYRPQLNIVLKVADVVIQQGSQGAPSWDDPQCQLGISEQLARFRRWQQPKPLGLWHLFDDCWKGGAIGLATMLSSQVPGTICMMNRVSGYNDYWNTALSWYSRGSTWRTFAHEIGHNFGGHHSFEEGAGKTGGIMDYGDGRLNGEYQFHTRYRKTEICASIQKVIGWCSAFAVEGSVRTTTAPVRTTTRWSPPVATTTAAPDGDCGTCQDKVSPSYPVVLNNVYHYSCATLRAAADAWGANLWCSTYEAQYPVCPRSCGTCSCRTTVATTTAALGIKSGESIHLVAHTGNCLDVQGSAVQARWSDRGEWQKFLIEKNVGGAISSGDTVFLKAHTGAYVDVQGSAVAARNGDRGSWQALTIQKKSGSGSILPGDVVFFRAHTGNMIDVQSSFDWWPFTSTQARARWFDYGTWQSFRIEQSGLRRLSEGKAEAASVWSLLGSAEVLV